MTLDSNILIAYFNGEKSVIALLTEWRRAQRPLFLSAVVETEVLAFAGWTASERSVVETFLEENFTSIAFDRATARAAAALRRDTKIKFPDAAIAATALVTHSPLVTRNIKDFNRIPLLQIVTV